MFHTYTVAAHLVAIFFPVFTDDGVLELSSLSLTLYLILSLGFTFEVLKWAYGQAPMDKIAPGVGRARSVTAGIALAGLGATVPLLGGMWQPSSSSWIASLHSLISVGLLGFVQK